MLDGRGQGSLSSGAAVTQRGTGPYKYLTGSPASLKAVAVPPEAMRPRPNAFRLLANSTRPAFSETLSKAERRIGHSGEMRPSEAPQRTKPPLSTEPPRGSHVARASPPPLPSHPATRYRAAAGRPWRALRAREGGRKERSDRGRPEGIWAPTAAPRGRAGRKRQSSG